VNKPYSPSCERNRGPILDLLKTHFAACRRVLEVGSGTGQHAVHFAAAMPHLEWQTSDLPENLPGIDAWLREAKLTNAPPPIELDVGGTWPAGQFDALFSANTLHIMSWERVRALFARMPAVLTDEAVVAVYGPFNYDGRYTSDSNAAFDRWLKEQGGHMGVRDFEEVDALARAAGLTLVQDCAMPANNRTLIWRLARG
jgi:cyclopropane fatty-acyl-phospholipid synthase-like methyltransferase